MFLVNMLANRRFLVGDGSSPHSLQFSLLAGVVEYEPDPELCDTE
jgi:hypothetical protein